MTRFNLAQSLAFVSLFTVVFWSWTHRDAFVAISEGWVIQGSDDANGSTLHRQHVYDFLPSQLGRLAWASQGDGGSGESAREITASYTVLDVKKETLLSHTPSHLGQRFQLCRSCNCSEPDSYAGRGLSSSHLAQRPLSIESAVASVVEQHILLHGWYEPVFTYNQTLLDLYKQYLTCPDRSLALNLPSLRLDLPTMYLYTRTGPSSKLGNGRELYMRLHAKNIKQHLDIVARDGYHDGVKGSARQVVWLVVEDNSFIDPNVDDLLYESGLNYIYFAHGPTRHFGKAQWNIALKAVDVLRDRLLGDGPIYNIDDDSRVLPELYDKMWKVKQAVVWVVGNIFGEWEGPRLVKGELVDWPGWTADLRRFPVDMNAFAINSSVVGHGRLVSPPQYIPFDESAGENEFVSKIYEERDQIEHLCQDTLEDKCYYVWHNWVLSKTGDPEAMDYAENTIPEYLLDEEPAWRNITEAWWRHPDEEPWFVHEAKVLKEEKKAKEEETAREKARLESESSESLPTEEGQSHASQLSRVRA